MTGNTLGGGVLVETRYAETSNPITHQTDIDDAVADLITASQPLPGTPVDITDYIHSAQPRKKLVCPAPPECEIDHLPTDIGDYLVKMLPSMHAVAASGALLPLKDPEVSVIVQDFIVYILENDSDGLARWKRYDDTIKPRPKYNQYLLRIVQFFCKTYLTTRAKAVRREVGIQDYDKAQGDDTVEPGRIHYSTLERFLDPDTQPQSAEDRLKDQELHAVYDRAVEHLGRIQKVYSKMSPISWQAHALDIFLALYDGQPLTEIKDKFNISRTSMNKWAGNVFKEVRMHLDGKNPFH